MSGSVLIVTSKLIEMDKLGRNEAVIGNHDPVISAIRALCKMHRQFGEGPCFAYIEVWCRGPTSSLTRANVPLLACLSPKRHARIE
jgi:hypothetical protein